MLGISNRTAMMAFGQVLQLLLFGLRLRGYNSFQATSLANYNTCSICRLRRESRRTIFQPSPKPSKKGVCALFGVANDNEAMELASTESEELPIVVTNWTCPYPATEPLLAKSLDGRLLCAAQCAYDIDDDEPYYRSASFLPGSTVKRITRGVNSVTVGRTVDGIVVSFRGTVSTSPLDWLQNAALFLYNPGDGIEGKVHLGFFSAVKALWLPLRAALKEMTRTSESRIFLTGHSKGGALAAIAALFVQRDKELPDPDYVCSFAAPKVGNIDFAKAYNRDVKQTSYEAYLDLVPLLPPSSRMMESMGEEMTEMIDGIMWSDEERSQSRGYRWEYEPLGVRKYIDKKNGIVVPVTEEIDDARIREIEELTIISFAKFRAAHCSSCPGESCDGRYFKAVATTVCADC